MLALAGEEVETLSMDHHGLVAAVCKDLKISERIDARLGVEPGRVVSAGQAVVQTRLHYLERLISLCLTHHSEFRSSLI